MHTPLGIYVHIPFCRQKCIYCDFYSLPNREEEMDAYCAALETRLLETDFSGCAADTVYFGGGTPSLLGPARLNAVLATVCRACEVVPEAEITLEANPDSAGVGRRTGLAGPGAYHGTGAEGGGRGAVGRL